MKMINPCKDCERKGCGVYHDVCEKHKKWRKQEAKIKKIKQDISKTYPTAKTPVHFNTKGKVTPLKDYKK